MLEILSANWNAPAHVKALTTKRILNHHANEEQKNSSPYLGFNLGLHVGDDPHRVNLNRHRLQTELSLQDPPIWLNQTHSNQCIIVEKTSLRDADAASTRQKNQPLAIMTADCLPIMICNTEGTEIAAIHAGWKGLCHGIIENTLKTLQTSPHQLMAWIGPAICHQCFEIGPEVKDAFLKNYPYLNLTFHNHQEKCYGNLPLMAELILNTCGINKVFQSGACTFEQDDEFYSYRKQSTTGRMATLIWLTHP